MDYLIVESGVIFKKEDGLGENTILEINLYFSTLEGT